MFYKHILCIHIYVIYLCVSVCMHIYLSTYLLSIML